LDHPKIAKHIMMQFSMHGTDEKTRSDLLQLPTGYKLMGIEEISEFVTEYAKFELARSVSLNFILFKGIQYDFSKIGRLFRPQDVYVRLSPLNMTENAHNDNLQGMLQEDDVTYQAPISSAELQAVLSDLERTGLPYAYAPAIDEEIRYQAACGQALEMLKMNNLTTFPSHARASVTQTVPNSLRLVF
ncbi:MAG: hypothetical protein KDD53_09770, partial [Bdellovibrionales bacterium]|nr:hypothetical protein [Bdellovibrionales bacterium]